MMKEYIGLLAFLLCIFPTWAQAADSSAYQTPEYSGPSAKFDNGRERYREKQMNVQDAIRQQQRDQQLRHNDLSVDRAFEQRLRETQSEMDRRRDEVRRSYHSNE